MTTEPLTERVPVMMGASLVAELDAAAKFHGISRSELIRRKLEADASIQRDAARFQARTDPAAEERTDTQPGFALRMVAAYELDHKAELAAERARPRVSRPTTPRDPGLVRF